MKILVACVDLFKKNVRRQPWHYINSIVQGLKDRRHDVWILTNRPEDGAWNRIVIENFRSFPVGISNNTVQVVKESHFDVIFWSLGLTDFFFKQKIDVFGIPVIGVVTSPRYSLRELLSLGAELVYSRNLINQFLLGTILTGKRVNKLFSLDNLKALIFECKGTQDKFVSDEEINKKSWVIKPPLPVSFLDILNENRKRGNENRNKNGTFNVLYLGPPLALRGVDMVVKAFKLFHSKVNNSKLYLLSRIESKAMLKHDKRLRTLIEREKLEGSLEIVSGMLTQEEILGHILLSNVVCLPFKLTISDVPMVTLEVLATGVPLITTDIAGVGEFSASENCFIVPPGNPEIIAEKLNYIYKNKIGRRDILQQQADTTMNNQLEEILKRATS